MIWHGKVIGGAFGFLLGGPVGALFGAALGHQFDKGLANMDTLLGADAEPGAQRRIQMAFFTATFSIMGHIAKADGHVTQAEIDLARSIMEKMELPEHMRKTAVHLFNEGKRPEFPLDETLERFRAECHRRYTLIRMFIEIQLQAAFADGPLRGIEERLLLYICDRLQFSRFEFQALKAIQEAQQRFTGAETGYDYRYRQRQSPPRTRPAPSLEDAYAVLGVKSSATNAEVKRAYRRLMSQHHPDKLVANGLPEEMVKIATEKTQKISKAYELISAARKL
jgi:DnaJ like chaperone protein